MFFFVNFYPCSNAQLIIVQFWPVIISLWCVHSPQLTDRRFSQFFCVISLQTDGASLMLNAVKKFLEMSFIYQDG